MAWTYRKRLVFGPVRINLSRSGIGRSWGIRGFRLTHSSTRRRYVTLTLTGTGLTWQKTRVSRHVVVCRKGLRRTCPLEFEQHEIPQQALTSHSQAEHLRGRRLTDFHRGSNLRLARVLTALKVLIRTNNPMPSWRETPVNRPGEFGGLMFPA
jgi:hypothetical protein